MSTWCFNIQFLPILSFFSAKYNCTVHTCILACLSLCSLCVLLYRWQEGKKAIFITYPHQDRHTQLDVVDQWKWVTLSRPLAVWLYYHQWTTVEPKDTMCLTQGSHIQYLTLKSTVTDSLRTKVVQSHLFWACLTGARCIDRCITCQIACRIMLHHLRHSNKVEKFLNVQL